MHACASFFFQICTVFQINYHFPDIKSFPLGECRLPMEYLQRRDKPELYTWDEWFEYSNKEFVQSQISLKQQEEEAAILKQKQKEKDAQLAQQLCRDMTKNLLPSVSTFGDTSKKDTQQKVVPKPVSPVKIKTEPRLKCPEENKNKNGVTSKKVVQSTNGSFSMKVKPDIVAKEKQSEEQILKLADAVKTFVQELSDMFHDERVVAAMEHLKKIGGDLCEMPMPAKSEEKSSSNIGAKQRIQATPSGLLSAVVLIFHRNKYRTSNGTLTLLRGIGKCFLE